LQPDTHHALNLSYETDCIAFARSGDVDIGLFHTELTDYKVIAAITEDVAGRDEPVTIYADYFDTVAEAMCAFSNFITSEYEGA
jgi:hypothetical protein